MQGKGWAGWAEAALLLGAVCAFTPAFGEAPKDAAVRPLAEATVAPGGMFPFYLGTTGRGCSYPAIANPPILDEDGNAWYSSHLKAAGERSMIDVAASAPGKMHVRFTWLRSFDRPIVVRIDEQADGSASISAVMLSGAGGYEPGKVAKRASRRLTASEWTSFKAQLDRSGLKDEAAANCEFGLDGAQWIVETVTDGRYAFFDRWSPDDGAVRAVGLAMLKLTGFNLQPIY